jgi:hypothetical protein
MKETVRLASLRVEILTGAFRIRSRSVHHATTTFGGSVVALQWITNNPRQKHERMKDWCVGKSEGDIITL